MSDEGSFIVYALVSSEDIVLARASSPLQADSVSMRRDIDRICAWAEKVLHKIVKKEEDHKKTLVSGK